MKSLFFEFPLIILLVLPGARAESPAPGIEPKLVQIMSEELDYSMQNLATPDGMRPYFISYTITDTQRAYVSAEIGALNSKDTGRYRTLDVDVRVGDYQRDNTHKIRGGFFDFESMFGSSYDISLDDDPTAVKQTLWKVTDQKFKAAVKKYQRVLTNLKTKVDEEDQSADFSEEEPQVCYEPAVTCTLDLESWAQRLEKISEMAKMYPLIYNSGVSLSSQTINRYLVNSEGTKIQTNQKFLRVSVSASSKAEDGMEIDQSEYFCAASENGLPTAEEISKAFQTVIDEVLALRQAPVVEPYSGPAILVNRASAVFFHEIFGHRIEGHRQKDVEEGQTFTKKVGQSVLPDFISVHDDPTLSSFGGEDLRGFYEFDDEGVSARRVALVDEGVLKNFLMSRSPVEGFPRSNGHGRRSPGYQVVSRMGNTIVTSSKTMSFEKLRQSLIAECKQQNKPYGLLFDDISGGYTGTQRAGAQVFKVLPIVVYRVYADGRPDELVRGVDIVGTPLTCFSQIIATGDDPAVFNGTCGAESGSVPVSGISPSILVSQVEIEKRYREQDRPPILPPPIQDIDQ